MTSTLSLFVHSTGSGPAMWNGIPDDVTAGTRSLAPPNIGYPPGPLLARGTVVTSADDAAHVLAQVPADVDTIDLYAHSYGALLAFKIAPALGTRLRSLFLLEPVLFGALDRAIRDGDDVDAAAVAEIAGFRERAWFLDDVDRGGRDEWLTMFIDYWNRAGSWARLPPIQQDALRAVGWKMFQEVRGVFYDVTAFADAQLPQVPTTLVLGARSPAASRAMTHRLARAHPWAHLVEIAAGHMAPLTHALLVHAEMRAHRARL